MDYCYPLGMGKSGYASISAGLTLLALAGVLILARGAAQSEAFAKEQSPRGRPSAAARQGEAFFMDTHRLLKKYSGNALNCASCHIGGGRVPGGGSLVGVVGRYPRYQARAGRVVTLRDRVSDCFVRSMNGKPLPKNGPVMADFIAYLKWISKGVPTGHIPAGFGIKKIPGSFQANGLRGKTLYAMRCASCHGLNGSGVIDANGKTLIPALWGKRSFNIGAGMARLNVAAAFIKWNMPVGQGGTLSNQQSYDIAKYIVYQLRPDFAAKLKDWPRGGKPAYARY